MAGTCETLDIQALVDAFVADATSSSIELPHMTTGQRKHTKRLLEQHPEVTCESYGFGKERKLHLFKVTDQPSEAPVTQDDVDAPAAVLTPEASFSNSVQCIMDGPVCKLDLASVKEAADMAAEGGHFASDGSTAAPSPCPSDASPASTFRGAAPLPPWFRLPPGLEVEVHNTFVHYKKSPANQRVVQTMPHCMFRQCLLAEALSESEKVLAPEVIDAHTSLLLTKEEPLQAREEMLVVGTEVVIEGLSKLPAFNGLTGTVQSFDDLSGRYNILLSSPVQGHKVAKVKRENFRLSQRSEALQLLSERADAPCSLRLNALL